jgi:hypothetical protein
VPLHYIRLLFCPKNTAWRVAQSIPLVETRIPSKGSVSNGLVEVSKGTKVHHQACKARPTKCTSFYFCWSLSLRLNSRENGMDGCLGASQSSLLHLCLYFHPCVSRLGPQCFPPHGVRMKRGTILVGSEIGDDPNSISARSSVWRH